MNAPPSDEGAATEPEPPASALVQVGRIFGTVVAPTTLFTAVFYYFGWMFSFWFFDYFGVNSTLLGLTSSDYLIRSVDGLFVPMTVLGCAALVALWVHRLLRDRVAGAHPRVFRAVVPGIAATGLLLAVAGLASVFTTTILDRHLAAAPLCLAAGVLLLKYAVGLGRAEQAGTAWTAVAEWAAVFALVGVSLFWAATDYSSAVGRTRARQFAEELSTYPAVVLYSERSLSLSHAGVREIRCDDGEAAYRFRYDGLKLVLQAANQYLFLPERWTPAGGAAVLLPRTDSIRLEFASAGSTGHAAPATC